MAALLYWIVAVIVIVLGFPSYGGTMEDPCEGLNQIAIWKVSVSFAQVRTN